MTYVAAESIKSFDISMESEFDKHYKIAIHKLINYKYKFFLTSSFCKAIYYHSIFHSIKLILTLPTMGKLYDFICQSSY
jgi:hypothetical protein